MYNYGKDKVAAHYFWINDHMHQWRNVRVRLSLAVECKNNTDYIHICTCVYHPAMMLYTIAVHIQDCQCSQQKRYSLSCVPCTYRQLYTSLTTSQAIMIFTFIERERERKQ